MQVPWHRVPSGLLRAGWVRKPLGFLFLPGCRVWLWGRGAAFLLPAGTLLLWGCAGWGGASGQGTAAREFRGQGWPALGSSGAERPEPTERACCACAEHLCRGVPRGRELAPGVGQSAEGAGSHHVSAAATGAPCPSPRAWVLRGPAQEDNLYLAVLRASREGKKGSGTPHRRAGQAQDRKGPVPASGSLALGGVGPRLWL